MGHRDTNQKHASNLTQARSIIEKKIHCTVDIAIDLLRFLLITLFLTKCSNKVF